MLFVGGERYGQTPAEVGLSSAILHNCIVSVLAPETTRPDARF